MNKKLAYSIGAVATALSYQAFSTYIIFFYVDVMKLAAGLAALAMVVYAAWNAVNDPVAGFISDRTSTPFGRRIPYIAVGAVPFGLIYYLLWAPPFSASQMIGLFIYFLVMICLFDLFYTVVVLNWASLFPEMFPSLQERVEVNSLRQAFGMVGLMIGISIPPLLYSTIGWRSMGLIFGAIIAAVFLISLLGSREKKEFSRDKPLGIKEAFGKTFNKRSFLTFVISNVFIQYTFTMVLAVIPFFAKYVLMVGPGRTSAILFTAFAAAFSAMFVWRIVVMHFGSKSSYLLAIIVLMLSLFPLFFVKNFFSCAISSVFIGIGLAGIILISDILISDIIDEDELRTKTRREGIYFGFNALVTRAAIALEAGSLGSMFLLTGYDPNILIQPDIYISGIRFLIAGLPIISLVIAFVIMLYYPLASAKLNQIRSELEIMHKEKLGMIE